MFYTRRSARLQSPNKAGNQKNESGPYGGYNTHMMNTRQHPNQDFQKKRYQRYFHVKNDQDNEVKNNVKKEVEEKEEPVPNNIANQAEIQRSEIAQQQDLIQKQQELIQRQHEQLLQQQEQIMLQKMEQEKLEREKQKEEELKMNVQETHPVEAENEANTSEPTSDPVPHKKTVTSKALNKLRKVRKQRMNRRLSRILMPKNALILLHELKPGCFYKVEEIAGSNPPMVGATVYYENDVLGSGQGLTKSMAKNNAAEDAIRSIVQETMLKNARKNETTLNAEGDVDVSEPMNEEETDAESNFPWAGLASFAIHKMFTDWQNQGADVSFQRSLMKFKRRPTRVSTSKKELPPNAQELHPSVLLNMMRPGLVANELGRDTGPNGRVTVGYMIDGQTYKGVAGNKKDARKEAAKVVLTELYGVQYEK